MATSSRSHAILRASFTTEHSVYGVLLVAGLIVVAGSHLPTSFHVLVAVAVTVVVFWLAHVYAGAVARFGIHHGPDARGPTVGEAVRASLLSSIGMLLSSSVPFAILLLGTTRVVSDVLATWLALWSCVVILAALGWVAFQRRGASVWMRVVGALSTASFGLVLALMKAFVH